MAIQPYWLMDEEIIVIVGALRALIESKRQAGDAGAPDDMLMDTGDIEDLIEHLLKPYKRGESMEQTLSITTQTDAQGNIVSVTKTVGTTGNECSVEIKQNAKGEGAVTVKEYGATTEQAAASAYQVYCDLAERVARFDAERLSK